VLPKLSRSALPEIFYDDDYLIVHRGNDGGDTAQREGRYWFGKWIREKLQIPWTVPRKLKFEVVAKLLNPAGDGVFVRHPRQHPDAFDKDYGLSRDPMDALIAALGCQ